MKTDGTGSSPTQSTSNTLKSRGHAPIMHYSYPASFAEHFCHRGQLTNALHFILVNATSANIVLLQTILHLAHTGKQACALSIEPTSKLLHTQSQAHRAHEMADCALNRGQGTARRYLRCLAQCALHVQLCQVERCQPKRRVNLQENGRRRLVSSQRHDFLQR